jgi:ubiquinone/menaquinone biosynthesis C-methylase UbiE
MFDKQTDQEKETILYYDNNAEKWVNDRGGIAKPSRWINEIEQFHTLLPEGNILEIGVGAGKEAALLASKGYTYAGIEPALGLLKLIQNSNPTLSLLHMNLFDMTFTDNAFDGFWSAATLLHIPKSKIDHALQAIKRVVKPEGLGFISLIKGFNEIIDQETNRFFALYTIEEMTGILVKNNFVLEQAYECAGRGLKTDREWLCFFVRVKK